MKCFLVACGLLPLLFSLVVKSEAPVRFDGHKVLDVIAKTPQEFKKVIDLGNKFKVDFWKIPHHLNSTFHIRVEPWLQEKFIQHLRDLNIPYTVLVKDVQKLIENEVKPKSIHRQKRASSSFDLYRYHSTNEINDYLDHVASTATATRATVATIGHSSEGKPLRLLKLSTSRRKRANKPAIFIDATIHAREWIAPATALYVIDKLAYNSDHDPEVTRLLAEFDWYVLPVVNPDGYEYSRTSNRMWRKSRAPIPSSSPYYQHWMYGNCQGVDLNRNFGFHWNYRIGGSSNPCENTYSGTGPFSEPESQAVGNFVHYHRHAIKAYLTLHSYGDMWLYPWGYTSDLPSDYLDLRHAAEVATRALSHLRHTQYTVGSSTRVLYAAAGGSDDYAKGGAGVKYAYTVELPPKDDSVGFVLPERNIKAVGDETWIGFKAFAMELRKEYVTRRRQIININ